MTQTNTFAGKLGVAFVAIAMALMMVAPAQAETAEELQAKIDALMATIASLQASTATPAMSANAYVFTRSLTIGSQGADVTALQTYLIGAGHVIPAGATGYFGGQTQAAVAAWQTANGVMPAAGYFGPVSQAKYAALMAVVTPGDDSSDDDSTDDDSTDDDSDVTLGGEASLTTFEVAEGDDADDVEEGSEDVIVGEFTLEFSDGDAIVSRIDLALEADSANDGDDDAFDVFEEVSLWVDGEEVARMDATDEDEYLDEDDGSLRFSGLDIVAMEDEEVIIEVAVSVNSSVDNLDEEWELGAGSIRFVDADDVTTTDDSTGDLQDISSADMTTGIAEFTIEEEGAGDSLDLESSSEDPDAGTLGLDEDNNVEKPIFAFELSAEDSDGDIELNEIVLHATTTGGSSNMDDIVNDFRIEIDGESYGAESYVGTTDFVTLVFDIEGDVSVAADEVATVVLFADFEDMESADEGSTVIAGVLPTDIDAEGAAEVTVGGSAKTGNLQTLRTQGLDLGDVTDGTGSSDSEEVVSGVAVTANYGTMFLTYDITAFGDNLFVKANNAIRGASTTAGLAFTIENNVNDTATTSGAVSVSYDIEGADENSGYFELEDGETYSMTVTVNSYNPVGTGGTYNLQVLSVGFADTEITATNNEAPSDLDDYESDAVAVQS